MKYAWIDGQCRDYPLAALCEVLSVSINGYRAWKRGGTVERKRLTEVQLLSLIESIHAEVKGAYGSPRMTGRFSVGRPTLRQEAFGLESRRQPFEDAP